MDEARWERLQAIFHDAVARPESERQAFLETACGEDKQLAAEVLAMLMADNGRSSLLDRGLPDVARRLAVGSFDALAIRQVGPYRLKSLLGEGGMGVVWLAEREDAGNLVAIKFLPHAGLSPARRERFALEIRALGKLKHPYIARFYDAGALADDTPWFVMEYVDALRLTEYCRTHSCPIEDRLQIFRRVCEAVQYAHGQEIIHRDLKPSNILVERDGTPRLLDFGVAKELQGADELTEGTRPALRFLSPDYAAPEWARDGIVGLFTDVYSLGVILYELLTGALPASGGDHPQKPSAHMPRIAGLSRTAWSDLDVLCLKAMHHEAHQRYQSVEALKRDLDHYLNREPLEARPDTLRYRGGKFIRRNRAAVMAAGLVTALIVGLVAFFTLRLAKARNTALAEAAQTRRVEQFMENLFEGGDKDAGPAENLRVVTLLDRGIQEAQALNKDRAVQADLYETLGTIYRKLGKFDRADSLLHSALDRRQAANSPDQSAIAGNLLAIGMLRVDQARLPDAERLIRKTLAMEQRYLPDDHLAIARATAALARVLEERGQYEKAVELLTQALRLESPQDAASADVAEILTLLADAHFYLGHYAICDSLNRKILMMRQQLNGPQHPRVAGVFINLGNVKIQTGRYAEAEQDFRRALAIDQAWYGKDHPETARAETYVAQALNWENRYEESRNLLQLALSTTEQAYGKMHPRVALVLSNLGVVALQLGKLDDAEIDFSRMTRIYQAAYGDQHQFTALAENNLASVYLKKKEFARAERVLNDVIRVYDRVLPAGHFNTGVAQIKLGRALVGQKRYTEAEGHTLAGYEILVKQVTPSNDFLQGARADLIRIYESLRQRQKVVRFRAELAANQPNKIDPAGGR